MGEIQVEGGSETTITEWISKRSSISPQPNGYLSEGGGGSDEEPRGSRASSSGLSSVGDRLDDADGSGGGVVASNGDGDKMDLT